MGDDGLPRSGTCRTAERAHRDQHVRGKTVLDRTLAALCSHLCFCVGHAKLREAWRGRYGARVDYIWANASAARWWRVVGSAHVQLQGGWSLTDHALVICELEQRQQAGTA